MSITLETRRQSYDEILENLAHRQWLVLDHLGEKGDCTAGELASYMCDLGLVMTPDRNNVHPRLNELVALELVQIIGKRKCDVSKKTCAVYRAKGVKSS